ncbi:hypothetical protein CTAYLR_006858 [Chrysophaeum taylorii]|uniref:Uncharacterized protein n=1 Tax=Chrysophaeum taylorii TaxID=2483200 RepID=A0AAD7XJI0_9STRA|nr:hypothetical protein CTAYLR_006858 [Chrysophaeum taylorii]
MERLVSFLRRWRWSSAAEKSEFDEVDEEAGLWCVEEEDIPPEECAQLEEDSSSSPSSSSSSKRLPRVTIVLKRRTSVPPVPDASLVSETYALEEGKVSRILARAGVYVDATRVASEHGSFASYRRRLVWQMLKRRWFCALTEATSSAFEDRGEFLDFVWSAYAALDASFRDDKIVGPFAASGHVRVVFKGGNVVSLVKSAAEMVLGRVECDAVRRLGSALAPRGISDVDFYVWFDYAGSPGLDEDFEAVHAAARAAAKRALRSLEVPPWDPPPDLGATIATATGSLIDDLGSDPRIAEVGALEQIRGGLSCESVSRRDLEINQTVGGVELAFYGEPRPAYVSDNARVEHRDARCVTPDDLCAFSLVRLLRGFAVKPASPEAQKALAALVASARVLTKGECVDVSFPLRNDVNLAIWCQAEKARPGTLVRQADLKPAARVYCESLDALILEQRDLTFGKRSQHVLIWRVAKASKRLRRLVELVGIKLLAHASKSWGLKATALAILHRKLARFARYSLSDDKENLPKTTKSRRSFGGLVVANPSTAKKNAPPHSAGKLSSSSKHRPPQYQAADDDAWHDDNDDVRDLFDQTLVTDALLLPLEHLALRVFADRTSTNSLPPTFAATWASFLAPLVDLIALFRDAAVAIDDLPDHLRPRLEEASLFRWDNLNRADPCHTST